MMCLPALSWLIFTMLARRWRLRCPFFARKGFGASRRQLTPQATHFVRQTEWAAMEIAAPVSEAAGIDPPRGDRDDRAQVASMNPLLAAELLLVVALRRREAPRFGH